MAHLFVRHKVADYDAWKAAFDSFEETRKASGEKSFQILHPDNEPNDLVLLFEWDNLANARNFMASEELKTRMQEGGVIEEPQIQFLNEVAKGDI
ncbi:MAG: antibiotic biosynthesis monooxygenase [Bacteroidetes bacterium]|nr:antibiotic biosynthesis monooxygenase [Bacteroidota bacterium]